MEENAHKYVRPAESAEGGGDDPGQAERALLSVLPQVDGDAAFDLLQLLLAVGGTRALGLPSVRLVHHAFVGFGHLVLQRQLHTGQELAQSRGSLRGKQHLVPAGGAEGSFVDI